LKFVRPDLYLTVLDPRNADFKKSAQEFLDRAGAVIWHQPENTKSSEIPAWQGISLKPVAGCPMFPVQPPRYLTPEIVEFVRSRLQAGADSGT